MFETTAKLMVAAEIIINTCQWNIPKRIFRLWPEWQSCCWQQTRWQQHERGPQEQAMATEADRAALPVPE